jgi:hypothetical protein
MKHVLFKNRDYARRSLQIFTFLLASGMTFFANPSLAQEKKGNCPATAAAHLLANTVPKTQKPEKQQKPPQNRGQKASQTTGKTSSVR